ncbi:MAG: AmmeMemoRadiSam system radical SAM enzyme [Candidatus Aureabacteria bacterium]|nr:AmmeMemoRadiSam system radical SAM enzyme [Candidatus Auribacterota bacterium]
MRLTRREFLTHGGLAACALGVPSILRGAAGDTAPREAMHYVRMEGSLLHCQLCPRNCLIADGLRGHCGVRQNRGGKLTTIVYGKPCTYHNDPIEKKPLFHYLPGTTAFSLATAGCNLGCKFCQNWQISQARPEEVTAFDMPPEQVVAMAIREKSPTIAYTYTEPVIFYEYMYDTARRGKARGVRSVMITNGFIQPTPMKELCAHLAAVKVDLKAFTQKFYQEICDGTLAPVLETLKLLKKAGVWHEIVVLLVPTLNDGEKEITELCAWVKKELGPDVPVHFTRYYPTYKIKNLPPTPVATHEKARAIALKSGLHFAYVGNVPGHPDENTHCPRCNKVVVNRVAYYVDMSGLKNGGCASCGCPIPGVWS